MSYQQLIDSCFASALGADGAPRFSQDMLDVALSDVAGALGALQAAHAGQRLPILDLPSRSDDYEMLDAVAGRWRSAFDTVIVLGIGGSSLGGQAIYALSDIGFGPKAKDAPRILFMDNIDPHSLATIFDKIELASTGFIVISKSGTTAEILALFLLILQKLREKLDDSRVKRHCLVITEPKETPLRFLAHSRDIQTLDHDPGIGGRFSALSLVGLLPALIAGLDMRAIRAGAERVLNEVLEAHAAAHCRPALGAALHVGLMRAGYSQAVLMAYADRLQAFCQWWRQLWAESLGKAGHGTTPITALGAVDQHSQLQLYLDGPADKFYTLLVLDTRDKGARIDPDAAKEIGMNWLAGRTIGDLLAAEAKATADILAKHGRPVRTFRLGRLSEGEIGTLMMHFQLETILAAGALGIDPFDQPAVEEGKRLARQYLEAADR